mmetsp:Transcript_29226/g.83941  ORF Transcript_29226/g.83941 Transcript_29226/m.83941 type:complete len:223 (+) Transcript_29226:561-1229(+)
MCRPRRRGCSRASSIPVGRSSRRLVCAMRFKRPCRRRRKCTCCSSRICRRSLGLWLWKASKDATCSFIPSPKQRRTHPCRRAARRPSALQARTTPEPSPLRCDAGLVRLLCTRSACFRPCGGFARLVCSSTGVTLDASCLRRRSSTASIVRCGRRCRRCSSCSRSSGCRCSSFHQMPMSICPCSSSASASNSGSPCLRAQCPETRCNCARPTGCSAARSLPW